MKKLIILLILATGNAVCAMGQAATATNTNGTLTRTVLSSGGIRNSVINLNLDGTLGQVFNFTLGNGAISLEAGNEADTSNTGSTTKSGIDLYSTGQSSLLIFEYYPNPVKDKLNLQVSNMKAKFFNIGIYTLDGKLVSEQWNMPSCDKQTIDVSGLSESYYIARVNSTNGREVKSFKFCKTN